MENYKRYNKMSEKNYNRKGLSYFLMRRKPDRFIFPYLENIHDEDVLEVGVGYGYYKRAYFSRNTVTGYDVNPRLGKNLGIEIYEGKAEDIAGVGKQFDRILSFFMTEYLNSDQLYRFINDSVDVVLKEGGIFATTIILKKGLGKIYTSLATLKGIPKWSYSEKEIEAMVRGKDYRIIPLNTYFGVPMLVLLEIKK